MFGMTKISKTKFLKKEIGIFSMTLGSRTSREN